MHILHLEAGKTYYGGPLQVALLIRDLAERGVQNTLICPKGAEIAKHLRDAPVTIHEIPWGGDLDFGLIWRLRKIIRQTNPNFVQSHSRRGADTLGGIAIRLAGARGIISRRVDNPESCLLAWFKYGLYEHVIAISDGIRNVLISEGVAAEKITTIRDAVEIEKYHQPADPEWFRAEFKIPEGVLTIGIVAQLIERKGHRHLLAALPTVLESHPNIRVLIFGQGPKEEQLRQQISAKGFDDIVQLVGFRDDLPRVLPNLDIQVHPADMEGMGVALLQGSIAGLPIIASRVGGIPEVVQHEQTGLLIEPGSVAELEIALNRLLENPQLCRTFGNAARDYVRDNFSVNTMSDAHFALYEAASTKQSET